MNFAGMAWVARQSPGDVSYNGEIMTELMEKIMTGRRVSTAGPVAHCQRGGNSLGMARAAMSEIQICGIPKRQSQGVDPTP
jgi:hypothetical protein